MELIITENYAALSRAAAERMAAVIRAKPDAAVVVATGNTPMGMYRELAERRGRGEIDTSRLRVFQLDAYLGLTDDDPRSLYGWMKRAFLDPLGVSDANVVRLLGDAADPAGVCRAYDRAVEQVGGFDLSVLGLGPNGHLGFNEPPSAADAPTRVVGLTPASVASNAPYWGGAGRVPRKALTAGMIQLLGARQTILVVSGAHKQEILRRTLEDRPTPDVPSSYLQQAANVTIIADRAAWPGGKQSS